MEFEADTEQEKELLAMLQKTFIKWARKNGFKPMYIDGSTIVEYRKVLAEKVKKYKELIEDFGDLTYEDQSLIKELVQKLKI